MSYQVDNYQPSPSPIKNSEVLLQDQGYQQEEPTVQEKDWRDYQGYDQAMNYQGDLIGSRNMDRRLDRAVHTDMKKSLNHLL